MKRHSLSTLMLLAVLLPAGAARAQPDGPLTGFEAIVYRPRRHYESPPPSPPPPTPGPHGVSQFHMGFFNPEMVSNTGFVFGYRGGLAANDHFQIGVNLDWHYSSQEQATIVSEVQLPTGGVAQTQRVLSRASSNLFPMLGYAQISGGALLPIIPYVGAGAGYELYWLQADDFLTGSHFYAQYGGFAWQAWAGAAIPLSRRSRLTAEGFWNQADLGRDVFGGPVVYRETVDGNGAGMRFGMDWSF